MKKIQIDVPETFHVPETIYTHDAHKVITIGDIMYSKGVPFLMENDPQQSHMLREATSKHQLEMKNMQDKMDQLSQTHGEHVQSMML